MELDKNAMGSTPADEQHPPNEELVRRTQEGDEEAFQALVDRYNASLYRWIRRKRQVPEDSIDDVVQEIWMKVYRKRHKLSHPDMVRPLLFRLARCACADYFRKKERGRGLLRKLWDRVWPQREREHLRDCPQQALLQKDDKELATRVLEKLSEHHREVLEYRYLDRMRLQEIAEVTGCLLGTVKSRLHNAEQRATSMAKSMGFRGPQSV